MPTAFPRAIVYDRDKGHHVTVVVRRDKELIRAYCADCEDELLLDLTELESLKDFIKRQEDMQVVSWLEVTDNGF